MAGETMHVYAFGKDAEGRNATEGNAGMRRVLGAKGANLAEMANVGLPVPAGFTISCQTCMEYANAGNVWPEGVLEAVRAYRADLEKRAGKKIGDADDPLLVSVRPGAPVTMPGLMDTVLDLGLNDESVHGLIEQTGNPRFAWDSYCRFIQMFASTVTGLDADLFENAVIVKKGLAGAKSDADLSARDLQELAGEFKAIFSRNVDAEQYPDLVEGDAAVFPQDPTVQLKLAIETAFASWDDPRAVRYRRKNAIDDDMGTAVNVQCMVFGNKGGTSATGVAFTRNAATGAKEPYGEYLVNAQGEDVAAGMRPTSPIESLKRTPGLEEAGEELERAFAVLEERFRDMMDVEFTIEQGKLYLLQARAGKRTPRAALRIAIDMEREGTIDKKTAVQRIAPGQLEQLLHPQFAKDARYTVIATGLNASPGAAVGEIVFSAKDAVEAAREGRKTVLVRWETTPDDLAGMAAAQGILTSHGGKTSHAAVIARTMGAPCVCGADALRIDAGKKQVSVAGTGIVLHEGDIVSIDGTSGEVVRGAVKLVVPEIAGDLETVLGWADGIRKLGVRANAETPEDAALARGFGAEGVGLCRTEHLFLGARKQIVQKFILADDEEVRADCAKQLGELQKSDFLGIFKAMDGLPVAVRLLDPPLHEFLDDPRALDVEIAHMQEQGEPADKIDAKQRLMERIDSWSEANPMLGLRGCRLAVAFPQLPDVQVRAAAEAAAELKKQGLDPKPQIMIPFVAFESEAAALCERAKAVIARVEEEQGAELEIPIGTMIELPRAALATGRIACHADFFSFGTNDLTQTALGFSRDDAEAEILPVYRAKRLLARDPFTTLDEGVAELVRMGCERGRAARPGLTCGACGEHAGDPASIAELARLGIDYVSCSPYRVPVARLAAAQAALKN